MLCAVDVRAVCLLARVNVDYDWRDHICATIYRAEHTDHVIVGTRQSCLGTPGTGHIGADTRVMMVGILALGLQLLAILISDGCDKSFLT